MPNNPIIPLQTEKALFPALAIMYRTADEIVTYHAEQRMKERFITELQIENIVTNACRLVCKPRFNEKYKEYAYKVTDINNHVHVVVTLDITRKVKIITVMYNTKSDIDDAW